MFSLSTAGILYASRNIDIPRKVVYRPRKKSTNNFKVDKSCRIGRTYDDFLNFMKEHLDMPVVEIDSVEGRLLHKLQALQLATSFRTTI